jgi:leucyl aminopeptidase
MKIAVTERTTSLPEKGTALLLITSQSTKLKQLISSLPAAPLKRLETRLKERGFTGEKGQMITIEMDAPYQLLMIAGAGVVATPVIVRDIVAEACRSLQEQKIAAVEVVLLPDVIELTSKMGEMIAIGAELASYHFSKYKSKDETTKMVYMERVTVSINASQKPYKKALVDGIRRGQMIAVGVKKARDLVNEPASYATPEMLASQAKQIAKVSGKTISVQVLDQNDCRQLGMNSYLAVAQGSEQKPQFIVFHYKPSGKVRKKICVIGKSITFDSGGYSIKSAEYMEDMKIDMSGGAAMIGLFTILSQWDEKKDGAIPYELYGILPACENMISGNAFRPGDIVTAMNGKSIEVLNTDAEGRLTLADALAYASRELKVDIAIDYATLTGASMIALGPDIASLFGNDEEFTELFRTVAKENGEQLWPMPLHDSYFEDMKSEIADMRNITRMRYGGAITAALFLKQFVDKMKWIHVDIAGPSYNARKPVGIYDVGATGWGVATLLQVITTPNL